MLQIFADVEFFSVSCQRSISNLCSHGQLPVPIWHICYVVCVCECVCGIEVGVQVVNFREKLWRILCKKQSNFLQFKVYLVEMHIESR